MIGSEGNAPSKNSTILADLFVTGECLRGQNVHQNKYPQTELGKVRRERERIRTRVRVTNIKK